MNVGIWQRMQDDLARITGFTLPTFLPDGTPICAASAVLSHLSYTPMLAARLTNRVFLEQKGWKKAPILFLAFRG